MDLDLATAAKELPAQEFRLRSEGQAIASIEFLC